MSVCQDTRTHQCIETDLLKKFLNSVLSSITTGPAASAPTGLPKSPAPPAKAPPGRLPATNGVSTSQVPKRKASGDVGAAVLKAPRKDGPQNSEYNGTAKPVAARPPNRPSSTDPNNMPYRGTVRSNAPSSIKIDSKPAAKPSTQASSSSSSAPKPASKAATPAAAPAAAGPPATLSSYKARIAAARAAQETAPPPGTLRHKPTQKELLAQKAARRQTLSKTKTGTIAGRTGKDVKAPEPVREKKPVVESGYKGTIRPKSSEPTYSGTARTGPVSKPQRISSERNYDRYSTHKSGGRYKYASYSDEEEDDYASDGSSDMEAGALDLDEEEELSLRQARAEDAAALREENELKRQKLARKQQMEKLVAEAQARKQKRF